MKSSDKKKQGEDYINIYYILIFSNIYIYLKYKYIDDSIYQTNSKVHYFYDPCISYIHIYRIVYIYIYLREVKEILPRLYFLPRLSFYFA